MGYINRIGLISSHPYNGAANGIWRMDDSLVDEVNGNNGSGSNVSFVAGKFAMAASFNGSNSRATLAYAAPINLASYTLMAWIKTSQSSGGTIFSNFKNNATYYYGYSIGIVDGVLRCLMSDGYGHILDARGSVLINTGNWTHVAVKFIDADNSVRFYAGGDFDVASAWGYTIGWNTPHYPAIGARQDLSGSFSEYFNGSVDDLVIVSGSLADSVIKATAR